MEKQKPNEAKRQLTKYALDKRVVSKRKKTTLKCLALVFSGWELKAAAEYNVD